MVAHPGVLRLGRLAETWQLDGSGSSLMNQAICNIDLLYWLIGDVESIACATAMLAHTRIEVEDTAVASVRFKSGALGTIDAATSAYPGLLKRFRDSRGPAGFSGSSKTTSRSGSSRKRFRATTKSMRPWPGNLDSKPATAIRVGSRTSRTPRSTHRLPRGDRPRSRPGRGRTGRAKIGGDHSRDLSVGGLGPSGRVAAGGVGGTD